MGRPRVLTDEQRKARQKEYMRNYWLKNKEKIKAKRRENPNNILYQKKWCEKNAEHLREYRRDYQRKNREHINQYHREYYHKRKDNMKESEVLSAENAVLQDLVERQLANINDTIQDCLDRMKG